MANPKKTFSPKISYFIFYYNLCLLNLKCADKANPWSGFLWSFPEDIFIIRAVYLSLDIFEFRAIVNLDLAQNHKIFFFSHPTKGKVYKIINISNFHTIKYFLLRNTNNFFCTNDLYFQSFDNIFTLSPPFLVSRDI